MPRRRYDSKYIIHSDYRFVYFVIQKVACTSIKTALLPLFDLNTTRFETTWADGTVHVQVHKVFDRSDHQVDKNGMLGGLNDEYRDHFKFAFVRNPWDRLVSCYSNKFADQKKGLDGPRSREERFYPEMPFAEFVEAVHATPDEGANPHFRSQHTVICAPDERVMADFVGRFEDLREDFARVAERIGVPALALPHRQRSVGRGSADYRNHYDERLKRLVAERYEKDIDTFEYAF